MGLGTWLKSQVQMLSTGEYRDGTEPKSGGKSKGSGKAPSLPSAHHLAGEHARLAKESHAKAADLENKANYGSGSAAENAQANVDARKHRDEAAAHEKKSAQYAEQARKEAGVGGGGGDERERDSKGRFA